MPPPKELARYMDQHFAISVWARDALIAGDLEATREPLAELADYTYATLGGPRGRLDQLQRAAERASLAKTLPEATLAFATMAGVCGECHREAGRGPTIAVQSNGDAAEVGSTSERMYQHMSGAEQLWLGLTGPSALAFRNGAQLIARAPAVPSAPQHGAGWKELEKLAARAFEAETLEARTRAYGSLLARCGQCHASRQDGPLPLCRAVR